MKKSKLLIPALSVASVGAIVAPMMTLTSCNKVYASTDDANFKGTQHAAVTGGWKLAEAVEDYFKDPLKHLADDTLYAQCYMAQSDLAEIKASSAAFKNAKISSFHASISNVSVSNKSAKVNYPAIPNKEAMKGALISGKITCTYVISYDYILNETNEAEFKSIHEDDIYEIDYEIKDCFGFLSLNLLPTEDGSYTNSFVLNIFGCKNASENWSMCNNWKQTEKITYTLKDGRVFEDYDVDSYHYNHNAKMSEYDEPIESRGDGFAEVAYLPSTYLSKVTWKAEAMPMGYRDGESVVGATSFTWVYAASPIVLTPDKEYTFYVDIKSTDKIDIFHPGYTDTLTLAANYPKFKIDGVEDTATWAADPAGSGAYIRVDGSSNPNPITKDCRLSVTFKIDKTSHTEDLQMVPFTTNHEAKPQP